jgi:hypothetical protein
MCIIHHTLAYQGAIKMEDEMRGGGGMKMQTFKSENLRGRDHLQDIHVDGIIILKWMLKK